METVKPTRRTRPLWQFRLRSLAFVILVAAMGCGWWAYHHGQIRDRRIAHSGIIRRQAELTKLPESWILRPLEGETKSLPWWLRFAAERDAHVTTEVSFDLRTYDDGFEESTDIHDEDLALVARFSELQSLKVPRCQVTDEGLRHLAPLINLRHLDLSGNAITDAGLRHLRPLKSLETLVLDNVQLEGSGLEHLAACPRLRSLTLRVPTLANAQAINQIPALEELVIDSRSLAKIDLQLMTALRTISLNLGAPDVGVCLSRLPQLERATISLNTKEGGQGVRMLNLPRLDTLCLHLTSPDQCTASALFLKDLSALRTVEIVADVPDDAMMEQLAAITSIQRLSMAGDRLVFGDQDADKLTALTHVRDLHLANTCLTDAGMRRLSDLKSLQRLTVRSELLTDRGVQELAMLPELNWLHLIGARGTADLGPAISMLTKLETLLLENCRFPRLTMAGGGSDSSRRFFVRLRQLTLRECEIDGVWVDGLAGLQELSLEAATAKSFHIIDLVDLRRLDISLHAAQEVTAFEMAGLPKLVWLSMQCGAQGARVPAETFDHLDELKSLQGGIIWGLQMPDNAREQLDKFKQAMGLRL